VLSLDCSLDDMIFPLSLSDTATVDGMWAVMVVDGELDDAINAVVDVMLLVDVDVDDDDDEVVLASVVIGNELDGKGDVDDDDNDGGIIK